MGCVYLLYGDCGDFDSPYELLGAYSSEDAALNAWQEAQEPGGKAWIRGPFRRGENRWPNGYKIVVVDTDREIADPISIA